MEKQVLFNEYQEQTADDHNNLQDYTRDSIDHLTYDAVTQTKRFSGFNTQKTAQVEIQAAAGRFYDSDGSIYHYDTTLVQSMVPYLAGSSKRIVVLTVYGSESETDIETRDYLVDVATRRTEPKAVPTTSSRDAVLAFVTGTESADPQVPATPASSVAIAEILLDTTQVVSVTMKVDNMVGNLEDIDLRVDDLEDFESEIGPRVSSLASDLAALAEAMKKRAQVIDVSQIYQDLARVKERLDMPAAAVDYGADRFIDQTDSDTDNSQSLGYDCMVKEGARFDYDNNDMFEPNIFSANDPNAHLSGGLLIPAYDDDLKLEISPYHSSLGIAQYGFQTFDVHQYHVARSRIRYGEWFEVCTNWLWTQGVDWEQTYQVDWIQQTLLYAGETYQFTDITREMAASRTVPHYMRARKYWVDRWTESYWGVIKTEHSITGAQIAQTILVPNDIWLTKFGFYLTNKAANEAVHLTVCEITAGVPDLKTAILQQTIAHTSLVTNAWTEVATQPTFLKGGKRYAVVLTSNANHQVGMAYGQRYIDGTFFYSTDSQYYLGDLTKDLMLRLYGAKFRAPQVTVELTAMNLSGGIRDVDITAGMIVPESTQLILEVQPGGDGAWIPLDISNLGAFTSTPPLARFRTRFVGTRDMQAGIMLTGSRVVMFRPNTTFKHISEPVTLSGPSSEIYIKVMLENFNETPHECSCTLRIGGVDVSPLTTTTTAIDAAAKRYYRTFKFTPSEISTFTIQLVGSTNSASDTFHIAERVYWAL